MNLECIVSLANRAVRLRFAAMERSLRATGCDLPLKVIPYDESRFDLPPNAGWWEEPELIDWLQRWRAHPMMRKYQCLLAANYQFVDADVCFLRDPAKVLQPHAGFVASCGHWHNPDQTVTQFSRDWLARRSTTWQKSVFNSGQWACDRVLYDFATLQARAESPDFVETCLTFPFHDQPGLNLLVNASGVTIHNLTLPPWNMASTWAGDYSGTYRALWASEAETPYLIHWAGTPMNRGRPIDAIFLDFLTQEERSEWEADVRAKEAARAKAGRSWRAIARRCRDAWRSARQAFDEP